MTTYNVKSTRKDVPAISINEGEIDNSIAVKLFGRKKLAYGQDLNENLLRLLETFACPQAVVDGAVVPDTTQASDNMFDNPVEGQLWYNSTPLSEGLFVYDGSQWVEQRKFGDVAANWGVIAHGSQIPLPVAPNGRTFTYAECSWIVSPYGYPNSIDYMTCRTDTSANVTMQYSLENDAALIAGYANYLIIGIPGNVNLGSITPGLSLTPTPTVTPTPTITNSTTPTPTPTRAVTPTPTPTHSLTPTPTISPSVGDTPTPTPSVTPSPAPAFSITVKQGDNTAYGDGLKLFAQNSAACDGFCGDTNGFAPVSNSYLETLGIQLNGGIGPYTVTIDNWAVDAGSANTMFNEFFSPHGNFSGADVMDNPLTNPVWTWTGGTHPVNGLIIISAAGKCAYGNKNVTGSARITATDGVGQVATYNFGWSYIRDAASGDGTCSGGAVGTAL